ncbi:glycosyltransferase family 4 protein [Spelaeicoccus albus]|uniref:D-inositol 3-phosphate glycosyltransferase n=1 Tax=Spelaeicoccus albus TaxID=1280376 RepID=A0A7Z0AC56_9MICO|nr:glycosyltransferase family 4 protein [Spelaeicoccus albus]NYI66456.1 glycosyltransferase involved in cell wall biosynthesis [Spelaeicoccus albus]
MKILLVTNYYEPEVGAPQRRWANLAQRFTAAGHQLCVLAPVPHYPSGTASESTLRAHPVGRLKNGNHGETIVRVPFREYSESMASLLLDQGVNSAGSVAQAARWFSGTGRRPDVVIASIPGLPTMLAGQAIARLFRIPLVAEMRDAWPDLISDGGLLRGLMRGVPGAERLEGAMMSFFTWLQRHSSLVVTTTESFAGALRSRGIAQTVAVRNGSEVPAVADHREAPRSPDEFHALYLGTVGRSQDLDTAVRAACRAADLGTPITLRIVGAGASSAELRRLANELNAPVEFSPPVEPEELSRAYAWADTHIVSLRDWPAFGMTVPSKLYEVMGTGHHVSGVLTGEAAQIVNAARAGDVVTPGDHRALGDLWAKLHADRSRLAADRHGRAWIAAHADYDALASRYLNILEELV